MTKICNRCQLDQGENYIEDSALPDTCRPCLKDSEIIDYVASDLTKAMRGLRIREKQKVIRMLVKENIRKMYEAKTLQ